ncbi:MAG: RsmD family RNA methyltransferase, partial [Clostridia bacterium]|nr:RsmD family RNA methyltransferase [Clostridia bacterium]
QAALAKTEPIMNKTGLIICESPVEELLPESLSDFVKFREYKYGKIKITTYCHSDFAE